MISRVLDGAFLTRTANLPDVRPLLGGEGGIDLNPLIQSLDNFAFQSESGGYLFCRLYDGVYEGHTIYPVDAPYKEKWRFIKAAIEYMFVATDCIKILTKVPEPYEGAAAMADRLGFDDGFYREGAWDLGVGVQYRNLPLDRWATLCSTTEEQGRVFHALLEEAKRAAGSELPAHPEDRIHDRMVGAAIHMIRAGNLFKGVKTYNEWAIFAGYGLINVVSERPVVVDVQDALVGLNNGIVEVLQCR